MIPVIDLDLHISGSGNPFHPYIGLVIDPADYIPFLGSDVHINGLKRGGRHGETLLCYEETFTIARISQKKYKS